MSWRVARLPFALAAMLAAGSALPGCRHGQRDTVPSQPFRDESEPRGNFEYSEGAVPAGEAGDKAEAGADDSSIEIEVDDTGDDGADSEGAQVSDEGGDGGADDGGDGESGDDDGDSGGLTGRPW